MTEQDQQIAMQVILAGSDARTFALQANVEAQNGNFEEAEKLIEQAEESIGNAHQIQFELLQDEANGKGHDMGLLMIHSQDHMMNAITIIDLTKLNIELWKNIHEMRKEVIK